jgi:hypothetical protein
MDIVDQLRDFAAQVHERPVEEVEDILLQAADALECMLKVIKMYEPRDLAKMDAKGNA